MNEQFKPIENTEEVNTNGFKTIEEMPLPKQVENTVNNEEFLKHLPDWNLEPPVEIDRSK
jgi:hypothetical protein